MTYEQLCKLDWSALTLPQWRGEIVAAEPSGDSIVLAHPDARYHLAQWNSHHGWLLRQGVCSSTFAEIAELESICKLVNAFVADGVSAQ